MAKTPTFKPGQQVPRSGQYRNVKTDLEVTVVKGERFPPTTKPGQQYAPADMTKHKSTKP